MKTWPLFLGASAFISGCASPQLNANTVELSATIGDTYTQQTLNNLSRFVDDENAIPSQAILQGGVWQTTNTVQPMVNFPFTAQYLTTLTLAGAALTHTATDTLAGAGGSVQGTNSSQQNYTVAPLNDANTLRNQQAIYQFVVYGKPLIGNYYPPRIFYKDTFYLDPFFLQPPQCVLCDDSQQFRALTSTSDLHVNPKLGRPHWLLFDVPKSPDLVSLGHFGTHDLFMRQEDYQKGWLTNLVFFTLSFTVPSEAFAADKQTEVVSGTPGKVARGGAAGRHPAASPLRVAPFAVTPFSLAPATNQRFAPVDRQVPSTTNQIIPQP